MRKFIRIISIPSRLLQSVNINNNVFVSNISDSGEQKMGGHGHDGHGHGHHHEPYTVPKPEYYANKVDKIPELIMVKEELAKRGLKDPWLRLVIELFF